MEENTGNQGNEERTFTQAELDAIVSDRLKRERMKTADYETLKEKAERWDAQEEANKTELQKANDKAAELQKQIDALKSAEQVRVMREGVAKETGVPVALLTGATEEDCKAQALEILSFAKAGGYPAVPDGGEVKTGKANQSARDKFADWFNDNF